MEGPDDAPVEPNEPIEVDDDAVGEDAPLPPETANSESAETAEDAPDGLETNEPQADGAEATEPDTETDGTEPESPEPESPEPGSPEPGSPEPESPEPESPEPAHGPDPTEPGTESGAVPPG